MWVFSFQRTPELFSSFLRKVHETILSGQKYNFFEPTNILRKFFNEYYDKFNERPDEVTLSVNIDGVSPFKNAKYGAGFWLVLCKVNGLKKNLIFPLALCYGTSKPIDLEFLNDSVDALKGLLTNGLDGMSFKLKNIICDLPAKAFVKGVKQYNSYHGCDRCRIIGTREGRTMTIPFSRRPVQMRSDQDFRNHSEGDHQLDVETPFLRFDSYELDMIKDWLVDSMHCIYIGVCKKVLSIWINGNAFFPKLLENVKREIDNRIAIACKQIPNRTFEHKPNDITDLDHWKADDFRVFSLYISIFALQVVQPQLYAHFLCLEIRIHILENQSYIETHADYAHELLVTFVRQSAQ